MADEEGQEQQEAPAEEGGGKKSKKMLFIIIAVVLLLGGGGGAAFFLMGSSPPPSEDGVEEEEQHVPYAHLELDTIIVNLSEHASFLKTKLLLEYDPSLLGADSGFVADDTGEAVNTPQVFKSREPMINDAIITVLSSKTSTELLTLEGKEGVKEELLEAVNDAIGLNEAPVINIFFVQFIVQ
ncbi:MAG: flagellar basal body-associated FliL family protein [Bdellovibrionales bacterium]|nr:flagellar basal body-associated FliL family protein [Bdellovibrionales bacterium]